VPEKLLADIRATTALELLAVATGLVYIVLIVRRQRLGWIAGAISSCIYVWLSATARLPMQSALQAYYVVMAFYGWYSWTRNQAQQQGRIFSWSLSRHLIAIAVIAVAGLLNARVLATETQAAWPLLDSLSMAVSLLATWMVARSVLQNWLYWIVADVVMVFLFSQQGHPFTAALFAVYLLMAMVGYREWLQLYRKQAT
jgi:nicotinamide mononucleotide transporter